MPNEVRNSIWAVFFLAGMAFTATLIFMLRPDLFSTTGVREKPGSSVVLGGAAAPEPEPEQAGAASDTPPEAPLPVVSKAKQPSSAPLRVEQPQTRPTEQTDEKTLEPVLLEQDLPRIQLAAKPPMENMVATVRRVQPGRSVFGPVSLVGELPPPKALPLADGFCGPHSGATTMVSHVYLRAKDNSLADTLVFLRGRNLERNHWSEPPQTAVIAQRGCQFEPYITAIQLGQTVTFENLDPVLHNVHTRPTESRNREWNVAQMAKGRPVVLEFKQPENFIRFECNVHPYMVGYICVMPHPFFALTKEDGRFLISNVPPGEYTVVASHRRASLVEQKIVVRDDESPQVEFTLRAPVETISLNN
jgi:plastocyanin